MLEALGIISAAFSNEVAARMQRVRRERNALLPINSLPTELSIEILVASIEEGDSLGLLRPQQLASVQRCWWDCIRISPHFWTTLSIAHLDCVHLKMRKSGGLPLTLRGSEVNSEVSVKSFVELVVPTSHRWARVDFRGGQADSIVQHLLPPLHRLRDLELRATNVPPPALSSSLSEAPRLRKLSLDGFLIPETLSHLTSLKIKNIASPHMSLASLQGILLMNPGLHSLHLDTLTCDHRVEAFPTAALDLHELKYLTISFLSTRLMQNLVSRIISNRVMRLDIVHAYRDDEAGFLRELLVPASTASRIISSPLRLGKPTYVNITLDRHILAMVGGFTDSSYRFSVTLTGTLPWISILESVIGAFPMNSLNLPVELSFLCSENVEADEPLQSLLDQLTTSTTITFDCAMELAFAVVEGLRRPGDGGAQWACPNLKIVALHEGFGWDWEATTWADFLEDLARMAEARAEANIALGGSISISEVLFYQFGYAVDGYGLQPIHDIRRLPQSKQ